jgi:hypothetical protein
LATPGTSSSKTVVPSGTAPSASPSARRCSLRRGLDGCAAVGDEDAVGGTDAVGDEDAVEGGDAGHA